MKKTLLSIVLLLCSFIPNQSVAQTGYTNRMDFYADYPKCQKSIFASSSKTETSKATGVFYKANLTSYPRTTDGKKYIITGSIKKYENDVEVSSCSFDKQEVFATISRNPEARPNKYTSISCGGNQVSAQVVEFYYSNINGKTVDFIITDESGDYTASYTIDARPNPTIGCK